MSLEPWRADLLPALVRYWNRAFADRRNFHPLTEAIWRERVGGHPDFDPADLVLSVEGGGVTGMVHVVGRGDEAPGGVAFLHVDGEHRRRGIGTSLWHAGRERLAGKRLAVLDGPGGNPFYGNGEGRTTPPWGTPKGVAVDWGDSATKKFLAQKGHVPRFKALHMALDLAAAAEAKVPEVAGYSVEERGAGRLAAVGNGGEAGVIAWSDLGEARPGLFGIHEARVEEAHRGRGVGRLLLASAVSRLKSLGASTCEALAIPDLPGDAERAYRDAGFERVATWALY